MIKSFYVLTLLLLAGQQVFPQTLNWQSLRESDRHIVNVNLGMEYGLVYGIGYSQHIKSKRPIVANIEYSFPSGGEIFDDFKVKMGGNIRWLKVNDFQFSTSIHGIFRQNNADFVQLANFGSVIIGVVGYYRPKWFVATEFGFDKAIVTHFKHSESYKENFPQVRDGWYQPSTGGNFSFGLQLGYSIRQSDVYLKIGKMVAQDFTTTPLIPVYGQLGYNFKF